MAKGPQKAIVNENTLPPLTIFKDGTFGYRLRYRIVSADANRFSHYSPIYTVKASYFFERPSGRQATDFVVIRQGPYVNVIWEAVSVKEKATKSLIKVENQYDVWLRWSKGESNAVYIPADRVDGVLFGVTIPNFYQTSTLGTISTINEEPTRLSVEIYIRSTRQSRSNTPLLVYSATNINIEPPESPPAT
jgi:hypothetical protein